MHTMLIVIITETNLATNIAEAYYGYYEKSYTGVAPVSNENWTGGVATSVIKSAALDNLAAVTKTIIPKYIRNSHEVHRRLPQIAYYMSQTI